MRKNPASEVYDIPQYTYFEFGNTFTGSYGKLSYKIIPGENFTVQIWHSRLCSELADIEEEQTYPMTEDGFHEMLRWLETTNVFALHSWTCSLLAFRSRSPSCTR